MACSGEVIGVGNTVRHLSFACTLLSFVSFVSRVESFGKTSNELAFRYSAPTVATLSPLNGATQVSTANWFWEIDTTDACSLCFLSSRLVKLEWVAHESEHPSCSAVAQNCTCTSYFARSGVVDDP